VFPEDSYDDRKMTALFGRIERYCFQGHTHIPGIFFEDRTFMAPEEFDDQDGDDSSLGRPRTYSISLPDAKAMINVGSVGQPRDGNPRSCYVILDTDQRKVTYVRLEYDVQKTRQKIYAVEDLDNMLGDRLLSGR
jgi:predicted phosphodiesterase